MRKLEAMINMEWLANEKGRRGPCNIMGEEYGKKVEKGGTGWAEHVRLKQS